MRQDQIELGDEFAVTGYAGRLVYSNKDDLNPIVSACLDKDSKAWAKLDYQGQVRKRREMESAARQWITAAIENAFPAQPDDPELYPNGYRVRVVQKKCAVNDSVRRCVRVVVLHPATGQVLDLPDALSDVFVETSEISITWAQRVAEHRILIARQRATRTMHDEITSAISDKLQLHGAHMPALKAPVGGVGTTRSGPGGLWKAEIPTFLLAAALGVEVPSELVDDARSDMESFMHWQSRQAATST